MAAHQTATPAASATAIFIHGNQANDALRRTFCNRLLTLADLDDYPRRAEFVAAFSKSGTEQMRRIEARAIAAYGAIPAWFVAACAQDAQEGCDRHNNEIKD